VETDFLVAGVERGIVQRAVAHVFQISVNVILIFVVATQFLLDFYNLSARTPVSNTDYISTPELESQMSKDGASLQENRLQKVNSFMNILEKKSPK